MKSLKSPNMRLSFSISPVTKWILTILILGVGVVLVVVLYTQEQTRNTTLQSEVDKAAASLVKNSLTKRDLDANLATANLNLLENQAKFPPSGQTMTMEEELFSAAAEAGVTLTSVSCPGPEAQTVGDVAYAVFKINISIEGGADNLLYFTGHLGYWLPSSSIELAKMSGGSMNLDLEVYALAG